MGIVKNVGADQWPKQGKYLGRRVKVCFHYDTSRIFPGRIVRDDAEEPGREIIALDDGRFVLSTECMYSLEPEAPEAPRETESERIIRQNREDWPDLYDRPEAPPAGQEVREREPRAVLAAILCEVGDGVAIGGTDPALAMHYHRLAEQYWPELSAALAASPAGQGERWDGEMAAAETARRLLSDRSPLREPLARALYITRRQPEGESRRADLWDHWDSKMMVDHKRRYFVRAETILGLLRRATIWCGRCGHWTDHNTAAHAIRSTPPAPTTEEPTDGR